MWRGRTHSHHGAFLSKSLGEPTASEANAVEQDVEQFSGIICISYCTTLTNISRWCASISEYPRKLSWNWPAFGNDEYNESYKSSITSLADISNISGLFKNRYAEFELHLKLHQCCFKPRLFWKQLQIEWKFQKHALHDPRWSKHQHDWRTTWTNW